MLAILPFDWRLIPVLMGICFGFAADSRAQDRRASKTGEQLVNRLMQESWEFDLRENPLYATSVGDHRFNDRLPNSSLADIERQTDFKKAILKRLKDIAREELSRESQINYDIFARLLSDELSEHEFQTHLMPLTNRWGFHIAFPELPKRTPLKTVRDYENYIARLNDFPRYADEQMELLAAGMQANLVLPDVVMDGYSETIRPHIVKDARRSLLFTPFKSFPKRIDKSDRARLRAAGEAAVMQSVAPTYEKFLRFMEDRYLPACRGSIAAATLPKGREFYRYRVRHFTTLDVSPAEVHQIGLRQVARIRQEMVDVVQQAKFDGDLSDYITYLREDPKFYAKTPEQLQMEVAWILKKMDGRLPELFKTLPRMPYGLREVPAYVAPKTTSAYYSQPAGDGTRAGFYYINTYNLKSRPLFEMEALSLHEAVPGHHLQLALQQELDSLPPLRRFAGFTSFVEGWALYAERLGLEVGFYQTPERQFGRLSFEMWRACRLVVDTGMHDMGWTRRQAIDFMARNTALSLHNISAEVDRYISWPGQALAYKMGEIKIRELRARAERELGTAFDIREFHDIVLGSGAVPLDVLEANVDRYIEKTK